MAENDPNQPNYQCRAYKAMAPVWKFLDDILGGTRSIKQESGSYLPQFPAEDNEVYQDRLELSTFFNAYRETLEGVTGLVFRKPPRLADNVPAEVAAHLENADNSGADFAAVARLAFMRAAHYGYSFICVDRSPVEIRTALDAQRTDSRPYWIVYDAPQAVNYQLHSRQGRIELSQITFREMTVEPSARFGESEVIRYRVWFLGEDGRARWELYREEKDDRGQTVAMLEMAGATRLTRLPVVPLLAADMASSIGEVRNPAFLDLAYLNLKHYRQQSDFDHSLHIAGVPILFATGRDTSATFVPVGLSTLVDLPLQGQLGYAEPQGSALSHARTNLQDLEAQMRDMGLSMVLDQGQVMSTATEQVMRAARRGSKLSNLAQNLQDALEIALSVHAEYLGLAGETGSVILGASLDDLVLSPQEVIAFADMVTRRQLSLATLWSILQRAGKLPDGFDPDQEQELIDAMPPEISEQPTRRLQAQSGGVAMQGDMPETRD